MLDAAATFRTADLVFISYTNKFTKTMAALLALEIKCRHFLFTSKLVILYFIVIFKCLFHFSLGITPLYIFPLVEKGLTFGKGKFNFYEAALI